MIYYILIGIAAIFAVCLVVSIIFYNKFQVLNTKISESYNSMDILFEKKANLLERAINIIKENNKQYKEEILLDNLTKIKNQTLTRFELNHELTLGFRDYKGLIDLDISLAKLDSLKNINEELDSVDTELSASKKYYNDNVVIYNSLVKCFPSNIVAKIHKYSELDFFKEEKIETLEILKEEKKEEPATEIKEEPREKEIIPDITEEDIKDEIGDETMQNVIEKEFNDEETVTDIDIDLDEDTSELEMQEESEETEEEVEEEEEEKSDE